jgi:hypothetical protein
MRMEEVTADLLDMAEEILCLFRYSHWNTPIHARLPSLTLLKMNGLPIQPERCKVGELLSGDIIGKIQPPTRDGNVYFYLFVDKKTGYMRAYTMKSFVTALEDTINYLTEYGHKVKFFRSDSEQIMKWGPVKQLLNKKGIKLQYSLPYAHYQNLAERYVQTVTKAVSTIIHGQTILNANLWNYALFHVVDCHNATPNTKTGDQTLSQLVTGVKYLDL